MIESMLELSPSQINSEETDTENPPIQDQGVEFQALSPRCPPTSPPQDNGPSNPVLDIVPDALSPPTYFEDSMGHTLEMGGLDKPKDKVSPKLTKVTYSSPAAAAAINAQIKEARTVLSQIRKERNATRFANGIVTRGSLAKRDRQRLSRARQRKAGATLLKKEYMQLEVMRAKQTRIDPKMIRTLDAPMLRPKLKMARLNPISALIRGIKTFFHSLPARLLARTIQSRIPTPSLPLDRKVVIEDIPTGDGRAMQTEPNPWGFAGEIVIQKRLDAMAQAVSEHTQDGPQPKDPGRHSFYVDAAVSRENGLTGLAVVYMSSRQDCASPWTVQGYRMHATLEQRDAEAWAIWQALQCVLDKAKADHDSEKPTDPCYLAVIYSDCKAALNSISSNAGGLRVQEIIRQSVELKQLGVGVQLHWVPGHVNVPGNELADLVSKKARLFPWQDSELSQ